MSLGLCSLVYGDNHLLEFNQLIKTINHIPIYVYTDLDSSKFDKTLNIKYGDLPFNFNLKRFAIEFGLQNHNTIICLDTDINLNYDLKSLPTISDGIYVNWLGGVQMYSGIKISINKFINKESGIDELTNYASSLIECGATKTNITFFDEFAFIVNISDTTIKNKFITEWDSIVNNTIYSQPKDRHGENLNGALESLIISLAAHKCGLPIISINQKTDLFFKSIIHYNSNINTHKQII
jgi:hypothetical protein